jgi:putative transposase
MARTARVVIAEVSIHVVHRGHDRADCFFEQADYVAYLEALSGYAPRMRCSVHAYCLMTNHVHLLVTPQTATACAQLMKHLAQRHSRRINARHGRTGTLWEGRFFSALVPSESYALNCYRYIERNPVRPGMVAHPAQYRWSSYQTNSGAAADPLLTPHAAYLALGSDRTRQTAAYTELCNTPLEPEAVEDIRKATRNGYAVGAKRPARGRPKSVTQENGDCHHFAFDFEK